MAKAGYAALKEMYGLLDISHHVISYIVSGTRRTVDNEEYYPTVYAPENTFAGHLEFALKYEGVNLGILAELCAVVPTDDFIGYIQSKPTGINTRRAWFFYELLTGDKLPITDLHSTAGYVDALDPEKYVCGPGKRMQRYRVRDNLLGNAGFCPVVRKTEMLQTRSWEVLRDRAADIVRSYDPETLARAVNYLYTKETRSSFAIEHEEPSKTKMERFGQALQSVRKFPHLDKKALIDLQSIMLNEGVAASDYRTDQNYVGETIGWSEIYHFISPKPEDVPSLMQGLLNLLADSDAIDPVVVAAVASFGFVFIHPFDDGNGRTHRYIIHHTLANRGVSPTEVIFPVSATMLNNVHDYDECLESFSKSIMPLIEYVPNADASIEVTNNTVNLYRYFDATRMVEYLYECIDATIERELKVELETVSAFTHAREALSAAFDLPDKQKNLLLKLCWQGHGQISKSRRKSHFDGFSDGQIDAMLHVIAPFFSAHADGD